MIQFDIPDWAESRLSGLLTVLNNVGISTNLDGLRRDISYSMTPKQNALKISKMPVMGDLYYTPNALISSLKNSYGDVLLMTVEGDNVPPTPQNYSLYKKFTTTDLLDNTTKYTHAIFVKTSGSSQVPPPQDNKPQVSENKIKAGLGIGALGIISVLLILLLRKK